MKQLNLIFASTILFAGVHAMADSSNTTTPTGTDNDTLSVDNTPATIDSMEIKPRYKDTYTLEIPSYLQARESLHAEVHYNKKVDCLNQEKTAPLFIYWRWPEWGLLNNLEQNQNTVAIKLHSSDGISLQKKYLSKFYTDRGKIKLRGGFQPNDKDHTCLYSFTFIYKGHLTKRGDSGFFGRTAEVKIYIGDQATTQKSNAITFLLAPRQ